MEVISGAWVKVGPDSPGPILALDTSTDRAALALALAGGEILLAPTAATRHHGRGLLAAIRDLLRLGDIQPRDLTAIGVGLGPGSFTGLRIGLTAAKTLAYAVNCPLYGLDSLEAIARNAPDDSLTVFAIGDAQRGDVFFAEFTREISGGILRRRGPNQLAPAVELAAGVRVVPFSFTINPSPLVGEGRVGGSLLLPMPDPPPYPPPQGGRERDPNSPAARVPESTFVFGPPLGRSEPAWTARRGDLSTAYPDGRRLIEMTRERIASGSPDEPYFLEPLYARRSAAEEKAAPARGLTSEAIPRNSDGLPA